MDNQTTGGMELEIILRIFYFVFLCSDQIIWQQVAATLALL